MAGDAEVAGQGVGASEGGDKDFGGRGKAKEMKKRGDLAGRGADNVERGGKRGAIKIWNIDMADTEDGPGRVAHHGGRGAVGQARRGRP